MIDRLEELLDRSTRIPATSRVIIDEDEYLRLIDQMRISVPAEIKNAREVEQERDAILEAAQAQGNAMVEAAREKADRLAAEHEIAAQAEERAERIVAHAREVADQIRADADGYALEVLENIAAQIDSFSRTVSAGIAYVQQRHPSLRGQGQTIVQGEVLGGAEEGATAGSPR
ncbi:MAG: ATPase [Anaerolineae bacterium]